MKFRKFVLKHMTLVTLIPAILVWSVVTALTFGNKIGPGYSGASAFITLLATSFALRRYQSSYMKKAERSLYTDCDPYPAIEEVKLLIESLGKKVNKIPLIATLASRISLAGEYEKAESILGSILSDNTDLSDRDKAFVYYNFAALYCAMNLRENAVDCYDKSMECFKDIPEIKEKGIEFNGPTDAEVECYKGNGKSALEMLEKMETENRLQEVAKKFSLAKILYITGDRERAISEFRWVAENANRLICAKEARDIVEASGKV